MSNHLDGIAGGGVRVPIAVMTKILTALKDVCPEYRTYFLMYGMKTSLRHSLAHLTTLGPHVTGPLSLDFGMTFPCPLPSSYDPVLEGVPPGRSRYFGVWTMGAGQSIAMQAGRGFDITAHHQVTSLPGDPRPKGVLIKLLLCILGNAVSCWFHKLKMWMCI